MEKLDFKKQKWLILSIVVGTILIASGIGVFCGLYFSTPKYIWIKNNIDVTELPSQNDSGSINEEKYYTLNDTDIVSFIEETQTIKISLNELEESNASYSSFLLNFHLEIEASNSDLDSSNLYTDAKVVVSLNSEEELKTFDYSNYPITKISYEFSFSKSENFDEISFNLDGSIYDENEIKKSDINYKKDLFYFNVFGE